MAPTSTPDLRPLFVGQERWGWEYLDPGSARPSPLLHQPPMLIEPPAPQLPVVRGSVGKRLAAVLVLLFFGLSLLAVNAAFFLILLIIAAAILLPVILPRMSAANLTKTWQAQCAQARQAHEREHAHWQQAIATHDASEWQRINQADLWRPLALRSPTDRVDVVGGVPEGWREMLITFGTTVVARHLPLLVLDLTQENVTAGLAALTTRSMGRVHQLELPRDSDQLDPLAGLTPEEAAEILAEAAETMRGTPDPALRATDADLLRSVARHLNGTVTAGRLAAGIRVLQRTYDGDDLTLDEVTDLSRQIDPVGSSERTHDQLRFLRVALDLLANSQPAASSPVATLDLWRNSPLTVITTEHPNPTRKDFTDRVLFHSLMQRLRDPRVDVTGRVLVVAGADHLGAAPLEAMAKLARTRGLRLVYFFEHLRDSSQQLLGGGHSATMIMRLGHPTEAATAAEYIGRGYTFKIAQITQQHGFTDTTGGGENWGESRSESANWSVNASGSDALSIASNMSRQSSVSQTSGTSTSWSHATSTTDGTTNQRVYEFAVEPQSIQTLPVTAFLLVEGVGQKRRAVVADANPEIATLDRVASRPAPDVIG